jgi:TusE/DsrC/DsvC family sulfur relay protein
MTRVILGVEVLFDEEGFFINPEEWSEPIAEIMASEMGIAKLGDRQWETIRFLRGFYLENGRAPLNREFGRLTGFSLLETERLFPGGIRGGARRLAGLPNPKSC